MESITIGIKLIIAFVFLTTMGQAQNPHLVYDQVMEIQKEFPKEVSKVFSKNTSRQIPADAEDYVKKAEYFQIEDSFVEQTKLRRPNTLYLEIPFEGKKMHAQLYKKDVTTANYKVKASSGKETDINKSIFYRGVLKGQPNSLVGLSITNNGVRILVNNEGGNIEINRIDEDLYAAYRVSDSKHDQDTGCSTSDDYFLNNTEIAKNNDDDSRSGDCIEVYIECDFDSFNSNGGSIQNTEDWALAIMNEVAILYANVGIPLVVSDILVYDEPDPYLGGSDAGEMLGFMGSVIGNNYIGRLAHVFSTRSVGGGVAFVDVLCQTNNGGSFGPYAVSGSMNSNTIPFPIFSWNVMVVAHELGHNVGSLHTHNCVWNGNNTQIDDCGNEATDQGDNAPCYDENNPILPQAGSIMSYCHLIGSIGIDFNIGFHPQVGSLLFNRYAGASCVTGENCSGGGSPPVADFTFTQLNLCNPAEVQFTDLSQNSPSTYFWEFPGGTPSFSSDPNPFVIYSEPGFYDVSLTVSNFSGEDILTLSQIFEVFETPTPDFDAEVENGVMKFTNQTIGSTFAYFWDFSDGSSSTEENPCYDFEEDGSYAVTLTVSSICGEFEVEKFVDFFTPPTAAFEVDTIMGCTPLIVNFTNQSSENTTEYLWTFEGGNPEMSTAENPSVEYDSSGVFSVTLVATNDLGEDTLKMVDFITVESAPTVNFEYDIDSLEVLFTNMSENIDSVMWNFGDGNTSTLINPTHLYEEEGSFEVSLTISNMCDTITEVQTILISSLPTANYSANVSEGCLPFTVEFTNNSSINSDTWEWSFPGGTPLMSTEENPTVIYNEAGIFDVVLIVTNESGADTLEETSFISVDDIPTADFDYNVNDLEVSFMDSSTGYTDILWNFGDGNTSTETNPIHTYSEEESFEVILTTTNDCGSNTSIQTISVSTLPIADFSADIIEDCIPFVVAFSNYSSSNANSFEWSFPGGMPSVSTEENPVISYENTGVFDVSLIVTSGGGKDTLSMENYITTYDKPQANFDYVALSEFEYTFNNLSTDGNSYSWNFGDEMFSNEENPTHVYEEPGTYDVVLTVTNECGDETHEKEIMITPTSNINDLETLEDVIVFPNPNNGEFTISVKSYESSEITIDLFNTLGQKVLNDKFQVISGKNQKTIHLENPIPGVYLMLLRNGNQSLMTKVFLD